MLHREARDRSHHRRRHRGDEPAGAPGRQDVRTRIRPRRRRGTAPRRHDRSGRAPAGRRGRGSRHLPAAELLRLPRAGSGPRRRGRRRGGAVGRARRPAVTRRARGARPLRLRDRARRRAGGGQLPLVRRSALRLPRSPPGVHPAHARTHRRRDGRHRGRARLCPHPADARAAHPPREGHLQHHDESDAACARRPRVPHVARSAGTPRRGGDLPRARRAREAAAPGARGSRAGVSRTGNVQGVCGAGRTECARRHPRRARARRPSRVRARARLRREWTTSCSSRSPRSGRRRRSTASPTCSRRSDDEADLREVAARPPRVLDPAARGASRAGGSRGAAPRRAAAPARGSRVRADPALHRALDAQLRRRHGLLSARLLHDEVQPARQRAARDAAGLREPPPASGGGRRAGSARARVAAPGDPAGGHRSRRGLASAGRRFAGRADRADARARVLRRQGRVGAAPQGRHPGHRARDEPRVRDDGRVRADARADGRARQHRRRGPARARSTRTRRR